MRKRRISADSVDSGSASGREMHPQTAHDLSKLVTHPSGVAVTPTKSLPPTTTTAVTTSDGETSSPLKRKKCKLDKLAKKHKKKHKHHHCKHKHKKHKAEVDDNDDDDDDQDDGDDEEEDLR